MFSSALTLPPKWREINCIKIKIQVQMEEEKKILHRIPVRLSRGLSESLYVFQFPNQPFGFRKAPFAARIKVESDVVELDVPTFDPGSENYDREKGREMAQILNSTSNDSNAMDVDGRSDSRFFDRISLRSSRVPHHASMMIGTFKNGKILNTKKVFLI